MQAILPDDEPAEAAGPTSSRGKHPETPNKVSGSANGGGSGTGTCKTPSGGSAIDGTGSQDADRKAGREKGGHQASTSDAVRGGQSGESRETCSHCGAAASDDVKLKACSQCRSVQYCGQECQSKHWRSHKRACRALRTAQANGGSPVTMEE